MANLSKEQAIKLIKNPGNQKELRKAASKRLRHKLHTEAEDIGGDDLLGDAHQLFLRWVKSLLASDENFKRFASLYRPPVPTNELVESIYSQFEKIFEANDSFEKIEFVDPELEDDFNAYRKAIGDISFWETQGFETFRNSIDNILVVDLPKLQYLKSGEFVQASEYPEPYYYVLDIRHVIDIDNRRVKAIDTGGKTFYYFKCEYLIFRETEDIVCVFDDTFYRSFNCAAGKEPTLIDEFPHNLGFTPARSFWTTPLNSSSKILKLSPITKSISELDWLLFFIVAARYLKLYAPFPIYAVYKGNCNYKELKPDAVRCVDGWLVAEGTKNGEHTGRKCPRCSNKIKIGAGNILEFKAPQDKDQPDLLANPVKVIPAEKDSLEAVDTEIAQVTKKIYENCVGAGSDIVKKEAINEDQVRAGYETKENVLLGVKRNFEIAHAFALDTVARLRYGDKYKGVTISYGTQFFQSNESQEIEEYKLAKEQGLPEYDLDARRDTITLARYRNNPDQVERMKILKALDPFPDKNLEQVMKSRQFSDELELIIKTHFIRFIDRFEREQIGLLTFGRAIDFEKKIDKITEVLRGYAEEYKVNLAPPPAPPGTPPPGAPPGGAPPPPGAPPVPAPSGAPTPEPVIT